MGEPAARIADLHICPMTTGPVPHVGGPIIGPGCPTVLIGGFPAARVTDMATCVGPPDMILKGSMTVTIGGLFAARAGDPTAHGGLIASGCPTVLIGDAIAAGAIPGATPGATPDATPGAAANAAGGAFGTPWNSMGELLATGAAMTAPLTQARAQVAAARHGLPFCDRCASGR